MGDMLVIYFFVKRYLLPFLGGYIVEASLHHLHRRNP